MISLLLRLLLPTIVGSVSLWIAAKATHTHISLGRIVVVAFLAQFLTPYVLIYLSSFLYFLPFATLLIQLFVWIGLVKFVAQRISIIHAILLGGFAFAMSYFFSLLGLETFIRRLLFG